ncbi:hypothetical protein EJB05_24693, partial [Eragrostis curvula]
MQPRYPPLSTSSALAFSPGTLLPRDLFGSSLRSGRMAMDLLAMIIIEWIMSRSAIVQMIMSRSAIVQMILGY